MLWDVDSSCYRRWIFLGSRHRADRCRTIDDCHVHSRLHLSIYRHSHTMMYQLHIPGIVKMEDEQWVSSDSLGNVIGYCLSFISFVRRNGWRAVVTTTIVAVYMVQWLHYLRDSRNTFIAYNFSAQFVVKWMKWHLKHSPWIGSFRRFSFGSFFEWIFDVRLGCQYVYDVRMVS